MRTCTHLNTQLFTPQIPPSPLLYFPIPTFTGIEDARHGTAACVCPLVAKCPMVCMRVKARCLRACTRVCLVYLCMCVLSVHIVYKFVCACIRVRTRKCVYMCVQCAKWVLNLCLVCVLSVCMCLPCMLLLSVLGVCAWCVCLCVCVLSVFA